MYRRQAPGYPCFPFGFRNRKFSVPLLQGCRLETGNTFLYVGASRSHPRRQLDEQRSTPSNEHISQPVGPLIEAPLVCNLHVKVQQDGAHESADLQHRDVLSRADHGTLRERHEDVFVGCDFIPRDRPARRQDVFVLCEPTIRPERIGERRKVFWVALDHVC